MTRIIQIYKVCPDTREIFFGMLIARIKSNYTNLYQCLFVASVSSMFQYCVLISISYHRSHTYSCTALSIFRILSFDGNHPQKSICFPFLIKWLIWAGRGFNPAFRNNFIARGMWITLVTNINCPVPPNKRWYSGASCFVFFGFFYILIF